MTTETSLFAPAPRTLTLALNTPVSLVRTFVPLASAAPVATQTRPTSVTLTVPDHLLVVEITP